MKHEPSEWIKNDSALNAEKIFKWITLVVKQMKMAQYILINLNTQS